MTSRDVPDRDMPSFLGPGRRDVPVISDTSLAALLAGAEPTQGSAPQLRTLAETLAELTGTPGGDELDGEAETLAAFRNQFGAPGPAHRSHRRRRRVLSRPLPVRAAAAGAAALTLGAFATAAYAGALPAPVQRLAHEIIAAPSPRVQPAIRRPPAGPPVAGHPAYGLCTAWARAKAHGTHAQQDVAFGRLAAAAGGAAKVTAYCAAAHRGASSHRPQPAPHGSGKPGGLPSPHGSGKPGGLPSPHGSGKPGGLPTPHGSGKPSGHTSPHGSGKPSGLPAPAGTVGPPVHPTGKPAASGQGALSTASGHAPAAAGMSGCSPKLFDYLSYRHTRL